VKSYGSANLGSTFQYRMRVFSSNVRSRRQFTAVALLLLAGRRKLSLSRQAVEILANFPRADDITLEQMLHHTFRLSTTTPRNRTCNDGWCTGPRRDVEFIAKLPKTQDFEPGTDWSYSNSAYFILGGVMEKAAVNPSAPC